MNADGMHRALTQKIIGAAYEVHNTLGTGFLEKVYENALAVELRRAGVRVEQQVPLAVTYRGELVGDYVADMVVDGKVIVEAKAVSALEAVHEVQLVNYLKATGLGVGLLINFGRSVEVRRKVFSEG
jgi:GxxExxY protein